MVQHIAFQSLSIEAFRGFAREQSFDLDASAVVLAGPNGTGKTSFFDAVQWLLLGSLERLWQYRTRQNTEHIVNAYRASARAKVVARMSLNGQPVEVSRTGTYGESALELRTEGTTLRGEEAERELRTLLGGEGMPFSRFMLSAAILQQDVMRRVLEAKSSERFELLNQLLGLHELDGIESAADRVTEAASEALKLARKQLETAETRLGRELARLATADQRALGAADASTARQRVEQLWLSAPAHFGPPLPGLAGLAEIGRAEETVARLLRNIRSLSDELGAVDGEIRRHPAPDQREFTAARAALAAAEEESRGATERLLAARVAEQEAVQSAAKLERLAATAVTVLSDECPVCGQAIDKDHVRQRLEAMIQPSSAVLAAVTVREETERRHLQADAALAAALAIVERLEETAGRSRELIQRRERLIRDVTEMDTTGTGLRPVRIGEGREIGDVLSATSRLADALRQLYVAASAAEGGKEAIAIQSQLQQLEDEAEFARTRVAELARRKAEADAMLSATREALVSVSTSRFRVLQPLIDDIFSRLEPHPTFKSFTFRHEIYRSRGTSVPVVRDEALDIAADPLLVFSSSQSNIAALAYFLAVGWAAGPETVPFLLLDDPLQSMDDVNVLGFADLCRHIRHTRQLIISTHVPRFASLLERKLAPRSPEHRTIVLEFSGWDRSGPQITPRTVGARVAERALNFVA